MDRLLDKLWNYVAQDQAQTMRERLYRLVCLVIAFVSLCVILPSNLFEPDMPIVVNVMDIGFGLFALFCFTESRRGRNHVKVFLLAITLALSLAWFLDGGMDGSMNFYFFGLVMLPMVFFEGRLRWAIVAAILLDFSGLNVIGYYHPQWVTPFPYRGEAVIDVVTGSVAAYTMIVLLLWVVVQHYDQERNRLSQSARELAASEEKFSKAFQSSPNGIAISELDTGRFLEVNPSFCRLCGGSPTEIRGRTFSEMGVVENPQALDQLQQQLLARGSVQDVELRKPNCDGESKMVLYSAEVVELGGKRCVVSLLQDVTANKLAEAALRFANRRLGFIAQMSATVLGSLTLAEVAQRLAGQVKEVFEVDACVIRVLEENQLVLLGASGVPPKQLALSLPVFGLAEQMLTTRAPVMIPHVRRHPLTKDLPNPAPGGFAFESFAGIPLVSEEKVVGVLSVYMTREPRVFTPMDVEHLQIVANHAAVSLLNERHFKTIRSQKEQLETVMAQREQADAQRQRVEKALGESEERLRQAQKMEAVGQLAGGVAHDFNNILSALLLQTELVGMVESLPEKAREGLKQIHADTKRAADLTRQLLLFSRRQVMQSHVLNLNELIMNLGRMLQRLIREDVQLQLHLHPAPLLTRADPGMLDQVLMNLAVNARDAMPGGGRLLVATSEVTLSPEAARLHPDAVPGRYVCMSVSDSGSGIPPEILPRIFEPFFTTKEAGQGTGLGLATVFGIVKQHQGWIQVDNRPGEGVTFQILLPATAAIPVESGLPEVQPKPRGGTETIFLVEDEAAVRKPTRKLLEQQGYQVVEAANGLEALKCWAEIRDRVALLFTDLVMPGGISGQELARRLQADKPALKVIYTSGYSADIAGKDFQLNRRETFVQKPLTPELLLATVRRSLDS